MDKKKLKLIWAQAPADYYEKGIGQNRLQRTWHGRKWQVIRGLLEDQPDSVLDVGCASGEITAKVKSVFPDAAVTGIDVSRNFVEFARRKHPGVKFITADAHNLPFRNGQFRIILATELLEHVLDPQRVLAEISRCLQTDGYLILSVDSLSARFKAGWFWWIRFGPGKVWRGAHLHSLSRKSIDTSLRRVGLVITEEKTAFWGLAVVFKVKK